MRQTSQHVCIHTCQWYALYVHNTVPCIFPVPLREARERRGACMWERVRDSNQPASQTGRCVWVQHFPGCVETLWGCWAPEVWTDGSGRAHRKVFGERVVLMFTASWLNHWGACHRQRPEELGTWQKRKYVCVFECVLAIWNGQIFCFFSFIFYMF